MKRTFGSSLVVQQCLLIMLSLAVFAYGGYHLVLQPAINELARSQMSSVAQKVQGKLESSFTGVEASLRTSRNWGEITQARPTAAFLTRFNDAFIPLLQHQADVSAVIFGDETGREILLMRKPDGQLVTRLSDPAHQGTTMEWLTWSATGELLGREVRSIDYDARVRPWFRGAMAQTSAEGLFWTDPYLFFTHNEPGFTGVAYWTGGDGKRYMIAHDIPLRGLSQFTSRLQVAQRGMVALLDDRGAMLALPRQAGPLPDRSMQAGLLRTVSESTIPELQAGYAQWRAQGGPASVITQFRFENEQWFGMFEPTEAAGRIAWLATFAPADEFLPTGPQAIGSLVAITLLAMALASWVGLRVARRVARPLEILTKESERIGRMELDTPVSNVGLLSHWSEVKQLGAALDSMRERLLDATVSLDQSRQELEQRVADRTQALARQIVFIEALLDTIPNAIFYKGADTRFIGCNRAYETMFGVNRSRFIGKTVLNLEYLPLATRQAYQQEDTAVVRDCSRISRNEDLVFADGRLHNTLYTVTGFANSDGSAAGLIGVIVDVTELKSAEQVAIKASHAARAAADAKSIFLANMSHEIRTPMNAILGLTHLVLQMDLPQRQRSHLDKVNAAAQGLLLLINDILDFSKIEAGKMTCENAEFSLDQVISHVVDVLSMRAMDKGLELLFDIACDVPDRLMGDAVRLGQVLTNLFSNAVKFTEHGEVTLTVACVTKSLDQTVLRFAVRDTGLGMNEAEIAKVFSAFTQADSSTTRRFGGTGLGLSICKHIVELMGGRIQVQSAPGQGSVFSFDASFGAVVQSDLLGPEPAALNLAGLRALIVDDNAAARLVFEHILQGHGMLTQTAGHGEDAHTELLRAHAAADPYRLLLLDWKMAQLDGVQTLRRIQATLGTDAPLCIMATAYDPDTLQEELAATPVAAIVQKPVTGKHLMEAIQGAFQSGPRPLKHSRRPTGAANLAELHRLLSGTHVLLVEDNVTNQELTVELLANVGITADIANDGQEALDMLQRHPFALVLMDCQMPVMDGFEATRRLRTQPRFADLPVIAMTANAMTGERERCLGAGMSDYLSKPIDLGLLYSKLVHWVPREGRTSAMASVALAGPTPMAPGASATAVHAIIDEANGLARTNGNQALYDRLLGKFSEREADAPQRLEAALREGDLDTALRTIHNLKGLAATIGGQALSGACLTLENELRKPSHAPQSVVQAQLDWRAELARLLDFVQQRSATFKQANAVTSDTTDPVPPDLDALCSTLRSVLLANDARANRLAEALAQTLGKTALAAQARKVAHHAARFDYDGALAALQALQEHQD
ncbi:MAG: response regulator [Candidatus Saccharibacteria bacterium]|nr:response regulator [Rhodoferax sp.]